MKKQYLKMIAPAVSAVMMAGCIGYSLSGYSEPVYAVDKVDSFDIPSFVSSVSENGVQKMVANPADDEKSAQTTPATAAAGSGSFDVADGTYEGEGTGFKGKIKVSVTVKDKTITAIDIVENEADDEAFFSRAKGVIDSIISTQSYDVDVVSGATYSSRGIINAVKNALTGAADTSTAAGDTSGSSSSSNSQGTVTDPDGYRDGTYYGTGTGFAGANSVRVKAVIENGKIASLTLDSTSDTQSYMDRAVSILSTMVANQTTNVDTVSGATMSSNGLIEAARNALAQAAITGSSSGSSSSSDSGSSSNSSGNSTVTDPSSYNDGTYYGSGAGYMGKDSVKVKVVIENNKITSITLDSTTDTKSFMDKAVPILDTMVKNHSTNVDVASGATLSSNGLIEAVRNALSQAAADGSSDYDLIEEEKTIKLGESGHFPYPDGIYYGTGGSNEAIEVAIIIQNKTMIDVVVLRGDDGTADFERATGVITTALTTQSLDIDVVPGSGSSKYLTYSDAILDALYNAVESAKNGSNSDTTDNPPNNDNNQNSNTDSGDNTNSDAGENTVYNNGTYSVTVSCDPGADGLFDAYNLTFNVTLSGDRITSITDVRGDGDGDNDYYINLAVNGRRSTVGISSQVQGTTYGAHIDTVSGATYTSNSIIAGINEVFNQARK